MAITSLAVLRGRARALGLDRAARRGALARALPRRSTSRSSAPTSAKIARRRLVPARDRRASIFTRDDDLEARPRASSARRSRRGTLPLDLFLADVAASQAASRVPGTAVFMTSNPSGTPHVLLHHFKHNKVLHEQVVLLSIATEHVPEVAGDERASTVERARPRLLPRRSRTTASWRRRTSRSILRALRARGLVVEPARHELLPRPRDAAHHRRAPAWRAGASCCSRSCRATPARPTAFFGLPPNRVVELGAQIEL